MENLVNYTFEEINLGDSASVKRTLDNKTIQLFALVSGDINPAHLDENFAKHDIFHSIVGHGMWTGSLFSALLGTKLPGPGTIYLRQNLKFLHPVRLGETIKATVTVKSKEPKHKHITFDTSCFNEKGIKIVEGEAVVLAPDEKIQWATPHLPEIELITN